MPAYEDQQLDHVVDAACAHLVAEAGVQQDETMTEHPDPEILVAYHEKKLTDSAARELRQHLAVCKDCAQDLLALDEIHLDNVDAELLPAADEVAQAWENFQERVRNAPQPEEEPAENEAPPSDRIGRVRWQTPHYLALVASIVLALGLGYWVSDDAPNDTSAPLFVDLFPDEATHVRDASGDPDVAVPEGMSSLVLRLNLGDQKPYERFRAEIQDDDGTLRWMHDSLRRQPTGEFIAWVPRSDVPTGTYTLKLFGIEGDGTDLLATYSFRLQDARD